MEGDTGEDGRCLGFGWVFNGSFPETTLRVNEEDLPAEGALA